LTAGTLGARLSEFRWEELEDRFGLDVKSCGADQIADHLLAWWAAIH